MIRSRHRGNFAARINRETAASPVFVAVLVAIYLAFALAIVAILAPAFLARQRALHRPPPEPTVSYCSNPDPQGFPENAPCSDFYDWFET